MYLSVVPINKAEYQVSVKHTKSLYFFLYGCIFTQLQQLVHLKEPPTSMEPEPAMDYVRRAVWGMLCADDACIVSR